MTPIWAALLPHLPRSATSAHAPPACSTETASALPSANVPGLALWAQQFTPRLACVPSDSVFGDALVLELSASERLFGGRQQLARRLLRESRQLGVQAISWAPTSLAAIALARCGIRHGMGQPLPQVLAPLPLQAIDAVARHAELLSQLGCQSLGAVHALPRGALARRMDTGILSALDQAHGLLPDRYPWINLPARFDARLELPMRIDQADALMHGARHLLLQLCGWLAAQRAGVRSFRLGWCHDAMRSRHVGDGGELTVHTASTTRDLQHLCRLLQEHLAHVQLQAPVGELRLHADAPEALQERSASLLPDKTADGESLEQVLERITARLGADLVQRPLLRPDHRPEWQVQWLPAQPAQPASKAKAAPPSALPPLPQPSFLLPAPLQLLQDKQSRPLYHGPLQLLLGPQRIEGGWWHRSPGFLPVAAPATEAAPSDAADPSIDTPAPASAQDSAPSEQTAHTALRDYWVAHSAHAGLLWIFHTRLSAHSSAWFLHGRFA
ncbi:Y-family DNA polymerase [Comamonas piscis]